MRRPIPTINIQRHDSPIVPRADASASFVPSAAGRQPQQSPSAAPPPAPSLPIAPTPTVGELLHTGKSFVMIERYEMALPYFQQAVGAEPTFGDAWFELGRCYFEQQQYPEAENALLHTTRLQPQNALAYFYLGATYVCLRQWQHAIVASRLALEIDPDYVAAYNNLGLAYDALGRYQEAIEAYECAIRLQPGDPILMQNFMHVCANLGRAAPAKR